jgi:hypothetical protein
MSQCKPQTTINNHNGKRHEPMQTTNNDQQDRAQKTAATGRLQLGPTNAWN